MLDVVIEKPSTVVGAAHEPPWFSLGGNLLPGGTIEEWLRQAMIDWEVRKLPQHVDFHGYKSRTVHRIKTGSEALIRIKRGEIPDEEDILTILPTGSWNPVQNKDALAFFTKFCDDGHVSMEVAGSLMGGKHVWALGRIDEEHDVVVGDRLTGYLLFSNPHQFGYSMDVRLLILRHLGMSTMVLPIKSNRVKINHRRVFSHSQIESLIEGAKTSIRTFAERAKAMAERQITTAEAISFVNRAFPKTSDRRGDHSRDDQPHSKAARASMEILGSQPGGGLSLGSLWNCLTAVTYLIDHRLGKGRDTRLYSAWYGVNQEVKVTAMHEAEGMLIRRKK